MSDALRHSALLTDLYELTMAAAYFENGFRANASFELFVRSLPPQRGYLLAAGLEQALDFLEGVRFQPEDISFLRRHSAFARVGDAFFDYLKSFRFTGEVWAVPEGTPMFSEEPLLRVTGPIIEAQIVETFLLSTLTFQTMIASKAARVVAAAGGRGVVEFGSRRAHGPEAGVLAARAAYIGGCTGTSNVSAGARFGIPTVGTLAHSFVMAYSDEEEAFRRFQQFFPDHSVLLVDTYDTLAAIEKIIHTGLRPKSVRLDSGDLVDLSRQVRRRLDQAGLAETRIFASGDLDEFVIADLLARGAEIDPFGVGTALATSKDAPALGGVYKLVDVASDDAPSYRAKFSEKKPTHPGRKQVFRLTHSDSSFREDVIARESERYPEAELLLGPVHVRTIPCNRGAQSPQVRCRNSMVRFWNTVKLTPRVRCKKREQSLECIRKRIMRYQSSVMIGNLPVISVAFGPDAQSNQNRGRAVGLVAVGDVAVGIIAVGAIAAGVIAVGGLGFGVVSVGGLALGLVALGGLAVGGVAVGGLAAGFRSLGGLAIGPHPEGGLRIYWPTS